METKYCLEMKKSRILNQGIEEIVYTDGSSNSFNPVIIGVYGDSSANAVDFQIYSVDGFEFSDNLKSIELKTVAFQGGNQITEGMTYQWGRCTSNRRWRKP